MSKIRFRVVAPLVVLVGAAAAIFGSMTASAAPSCELICRQAYHQCIKEADDNNGSLAQCRVTLMQCLRSCD